MLPCGQMPLCNGWFVESHTQSSKQHFETLYPCVIELFVLIIAIIIFRLSSLSDSMPMWMERPGCASSSWDLHCLSSCQQCPVVTVGGCPSPQGEANVSCGEIEIWVSFAFDSDSQVVICVCIYTQWVCIHRPDEHTVYVEIFTVNLFSRISWGLCLSRN